MNLRLSSSLFILTLATSAFADPAPASNKIYAGVFGGAGWSSNFYGNQHGTVFFLEANGGPLAVNAYGLLKNKSTYFVGAQLGYQANEICLYSSSLSVTPAIELEGYGMNERTFSGRFSNNNYLRTAEHDFDVSYPMSRNVFLVNAVLNFNSDELLVHPYIGFGLGNGIVTIANANSTQTNPSEPGVNHYNTQSSDTNSTFAGQIKLGLSYDIIPCLSVFAEYRWLYLANTHFVFGSTLYPNHAPTSNWEVNLNSQRYHLGDIGVRMNW